MPFKRDASVMESGFFWEILRLLCDMRPLNRKPDIGKTEAADRYAAASAKISWMLPAEP